MPANVIRLDAHRPPGQQPRVDTLVYSVAEVAEHRIEHSSVQRWVSELNTTRSPATVRKCFHVLAGVMRPAVCDRLLAFNPCEGVQLPAIRGSDTDERTISREAFVSQLLPVMPERHRALVVLAGEPGCGGASAPASGGTPSTWTPWRSTWCVSPSRSPEPSRPSRSRSRVPAAASYRCRRSSSRRSRTTVAATARATRARCSRTTGASHAVPRPGVASGARPGRAAGQGGPGGRARLSGLLAGRRRARGDRDLRDRGRRRQGGLSPGPGGLRFHDLRHSNATWLVSDGVPINDVQLSLPRLADETGPGHENSSEDDL